MIDGGGGLTQALRGRLMRTTCLVLQRAELHRDKEARIRASNLAGTSDPERFNAVLRAKGLPV